MCGACGGESVVSYREGDVVAVVEATGEASRTGKIDALDKAWGVAVTFGDGHRKQHGHCKCTLGAAHLQAFAAS